MKTPRAVLWLVALVWTMAASSNAQEPSAQPRQDRPAQQKRGEGKAKQKQRRRRPNPVLQPIEDTPGLPRVLLIGDSISMGYTLAVREMLDGEANVHRPPTNCGPTTNGLKNLESWLGPDDKKWDVIHFNWGLHDLKYMGPNGENLADPESESAHQQVPPEAYEANLRMLVKQLKATGAVLVWRSTTPVPEGARGRVVGDSKRYNAIAAKVMREHGVRVDDMYAYSLAQLSKIQRPKNVHFTPDGSRVLAEGVVKAVREALEVARNP